MRPMSTPSLHGADAVNATLAERAPLVHRLLSPLGRRAFFPQDIPFQAAEARGCRYNGTIGILTDGEGHPLPLPSMAERLDLPRAEHDRAFLYSPVLGFPEVRDAWARWQRSGQGDVPPAGDVPSTRPVVTCGLSHGLSLMADLFGGPERTLAVTTPFWGNYRQVFHLRTGCEVLGGPAYDDGRWDPLALSRLLARLPEGKPALAMLNFPSNPGGYSPTVGETDELVESLLRAADDRPLLVICDDAYGGLVYEQGVPNRSVFWRLAGAHENLLPVKIDGATKELALFGGRVGFVTFGADLDPEAFGALENKMQSLIRSTVGSPVATSQMLVLRTLEGASENGGVEEEVGEIRRVGRERYEAVREVLGDLDPSLLRPLPFNAGFFLLMELRVDLDPHAVRRHLIAEHDVGVVAVAPNFLRVALCSVKAEDLPETLRRVEAGVRELASTE